MTVKVIHFPITIPNENSNQILNFIAFQQGKGEMQTYWLERGPHERAEDNDIFFGDK